MIIYELLYFYDNDAIFVTILIIIEVVSFLFTFIELLFRIHLIYVIESKHLHLINSILYYDLVNALFIYSMSTYFAYFFSDEYKIFFQVIGSILVN